MRLTPIVPAFVGSQLMHSAIATAIPRAAQASEPFSDFTNNVVFRPLPGHES